MQLNVTRLVKYPPESSSAATGVNWVPLVPRYTASNVSKLLPRVLSDMTPVKLACHVYQMALPPGLPSTSGAPGSLVAPVLLPKIGPASGVKATGSQNSSADSSRLPATVTETTATGLSADATGLATTAW